MKIKMPKQGIAFGNKYPAAILALFFLIISSVVTAQIHQPPSLWGKRESRHVTDSAWQGPTGSGAPTSSNITSRKQFGLYFDSTNFRFYIYDPKTAAWDTVHIGASSGGGSTNTSIGSAYKVAVDGTNNVKSLANTWGMVLDSITSGQVGFSVDTSSGKVATKTDLLTKWGLSGNTGTTAGTNFIGTTDAQDVVFKANGDEFIRGVVSGGVTGAVTIGPSGNVVGSDYSIAIGYNNTIGGSAEAAIAIGESNTITGVNGAAIGIINTTSGNAGSTAVGSGLKSKSSAGVVVGHYNDSTNATSETSFSSTNRAFQIGIGTADNARVNALTTLFNGNTGLGVLVPTSTLHIKAGTTTAGTAPIKFTSGTNLTAAEAGAMEWDGTNLFITQTTGPTRKTIAYTTDIPAAGANTALSNLASVAINTSLLPGTDNSVDLGSGSKQWRYGIFGSGLTIGAAAAPSIGKLEIFTGGGAAGGLTLKNTTSSAYSTMDFHNDGGFNGQFLFTGSTYSNNFFTGNQLAFANYHTTGNIGFVASGGSGFIKFATGGLLNANERLRITAAGNVGIGTTSPGSLFTVGANAFTVNSSGVVGAGTWNGTAIGTQYGGTGANNATNTSGSFLRSNGTNGTYVASTLILPNAATANRIAYATSTNTYGESSGLTYNGTTLNVTGEIQASTIIKARNVIYRTITATDADFTAAPGVAYLIPDAATVDRTITLPASPADGDVIRFYIPLTLSNQWLLSSNVIIPDGTTVNKLTASATMDFYYDGANWRVITNL